MVAIVLIKMVKENMENIVEGNPEVNYKFDLDTAFEKYVERKREREKTDVRLQGLIYCAYNDASYQNNVPNF